MGLMMIRDMETERVARLIAAEKMGLVKDPQGLSLPDDIWRQAIPQVEAKYMAGLSPSRWMLVRVVVRRLFFRTLYLEMEHQGARCWGSTRPYSEWERQDEAYHRGHRSGGKRVSQEHEEQWMASYKASRSHDDQRLGTVETGLVQHLLGTPRFLSPANAPVSDWPMDQPMGTRHRRTGLSLSPSDVALVGQSSELKDA
jgi:hypothetical protein